MDHLTGKAHVFFRSDLFMGYIKIYWSYMYNTCNPDHFVAKNSLNEVGIPTVSINSNEENSDSCMHMYYG